MPEKRKIYKQTEKAVNLISKLLSPKEKDSLRISSGKKTIGFKERILRKYGHLYPAESSRKTKAIAIETIKKYQYAFEDKSLVNEREQFINELGDRLFKRKRQVIIKKLTRIIIIAFKILFFIPTAVAFMSRIFAGK